MLLASLFLIVFLAPQSHAVSLLTPQAKQKLKEQDIKFREAAGYAPVEGQSALDLVSLLINAFLSLLGILFLGLMIYGGFKWMNAQGAEEDVEAAKKIITQAVIGLFIILAAYAISFFVVSTLQTPTLKT